MSDGKHIPLLFRNVNVLTVQTRLINAMCDTLCILGITGNLLGLFTFVSSRRSWHISSVYVCLATSSSITNLLCLIRYATILHTTSRRILHELVGHSWWACKIYEFSFCFRVISAWITLFWMFERLICVSKKLQSFFDRWNLYKYKYIIPIMIGIIIVGCAVGPSVYMFQPQIRINQAIRMTTNSTKRYCGLHPNASTKWRQFFHEVRFGKNHYTIRCLFSELIPTATIILFNGCIILHLMKTYRRLHRAYGCKPRQKQSRTTSWMNIVLILHSSLFLSSLFAHILGHFMTIEAHETWWVSLAILINCSLNFYIYCLSGKAFRNEIRRFIHRFEK
ncbi:unnamed protein product [Adineta steineri]|uniref:G-protein coupled receptors family 1 profile domain-containing protein n=1 Tax=Adineta steineri TaxID=433720 RepID=A0A819FGJ4_9BILA|nr:unnamed protein product [Adineta steineri]